MKASSWALLLAGSIALAASCAKGSSGALTQGSGGSGATSEPTGPGAGGSGASSNGGSTQTTSNGSATTTTETSSGGNGAGGTLDTSSSSTGASCNAPMHLCSGNCVGNTPATGCYASSSCSACAPPAHGTSTCTANGQCDFTCDAGYTKSGNMCTCPSCCTNDNQCPNGLSCDSGMCACSTNSCTAYCILHCGSLAIGVCNGQTCNCLPSC